MFLKWSRPFIIIICSILSFHMLNKSRVAPSQKINKFLLTLVKKNILNYSLDFLSRYFIMYTSMYTTKEYMISCTIYVCTNNAMVPFLLCTFQFYSYFLKIYLKIVVYLVTCIPNVSKISLTKKKIIHKKRYHKFP